MLQVTFHPCFFGLLTELGKLSMCWVLAPRSLYILVLKSSARGHILLSKMYSCLMVQKHEYGSCMDLYSFCSKYCRYY